MDSPFIIYSLKSQITHHHLHSQTEPKDRKQLRASIKHPPSLIQQYRHRSLTSSLLTH